VNRYYFALWFGILVGVGGQMLLKAGATAPDFVSQLMDWHTLVGLAFYGMATVGYLIAIRRIPLSVAFPSISLSYVVVMIIGGIVFGEAVTVAKIAGVALIGVGVWVLNR
jgi:multidrug transporter EmrE-like cation transporter